MSLFSAQYGKCAVTGKEFLDTSEVHCHHKVPKELGGKDNYQNLILVLPEVHRLIHASREVTIRMYMDALKPNEKQLERINKLRTEANRDLIMIS